MILLYCCVAFLYVNRKGEIIILNKIIKSKKEVKLFLKTIKNITLTVEKVDINSRRYTFTKKEKITDK